MPRRLLLLTVACAVTLLLAACGEEAARAPAPAPAAERLADRVEFTRGGGLAGRVHRLTIEPDGRAALETNRMGVQRFRLRPEELARLRSELERVDLAAVPARSRPPQPVPDAFGYQLTYQGRTIEADETAMPDEVRSLFGELGGLVDRYFKP